MNTKSRPPSGIDKPSSVARTGSRLLSPLSCALLSKKPKNSSFVSTAYTFPPGLTASANRREKYPPPAPISAILCPLYSARVSKISSGLLLGLEALLLDIFALKFFTSNLFKPPP
jgi:hypothetical protein